jgi:hypothetical protein
MLHARHLSQQPGWANSNRTRPSSMGGGMRPRMESSRRSTGRLATQAAPAASFAVSPTAALICSPLTTSTSTHTHA